MAKCHPTLEFVFFDAGGGHRSAATSLQKVIAEIYPDWNVKLVNLQTLLMPIDPFHRIFKVKSENMYNNALKKGLTYGGDAVLSAIQAGIRAYAVPIEELLADHWDKSAPNMVVSLIPNFNGVMFRALRKVQSDTPYVTIMTDIADCPPHFWQEPQDQFIICGSDIAARQARAMGYSNNHIYTASGMILRPDFYRAEPVDRRAGRQALGLDSDKPTALIMFGGNGSQASMQIIRCLRKAGLPVQSIVMCGHNEKLRTALKGQPDCYAIGFTDRVVDYMALADFFIGKPGPGSISEALYMGLPVIVEEGLRTMPQERYNSQWVQEKNLGLAVTSFRHIAKAVGFMLESGRLSQFHKNVGALHNRAVFEIPEMLDEIMKKGLQQLKKTSIEK